MSDGPLESNKVGPILFQVKQRYNEDDLLALYEQGRKSQPHQWVKLIYYRISALVSALSLAAMIGVGSIWIMSSWYLFPPSILLFLIWGIFIPKAIVLLMYTAFSPKINRNSLRTAKERTITFFEDRFAVEDDVKRTELKYKGINKFVQSNDRYFIYIDANTAYILRSSCFIIGTSEDFGPFMREKYRTKDMETPEKGL